MPPRARTQLVTHTPPLLASQRRAMAAPSTHGGASTAAVLHGVEDVRMESRPVAAPAAGQALIRVHSVGICGSDMHYWRRASGQLQCQLPGASADTAALRCVWRDSRQSRDD